MTGRHMVIKTLLRLPLKFVILAKAGIQCFQAFLDARLRTSGMTKIKKALYTQTLLRLCIF
jgi:hypothetical protein